MSLFNAAEIVFPYRAAFEALAQMNPADYTIFELADWDNMECLLNLMAPLKIIIMMVGKFLNNFELIKF